MLHGNLYEWHEINCIRQVIQSQHADIPAHALSSSQIQSHRGVVARIRGCWNPSTAAPVPAVVTEFEVSALLEPPLLSLHYFTFWQLLWIPQRVVACRVSHKILTEYAHRLSFLWSHDRPPSSRQMWICCCAIFCGSGDHLDGVHTTAHEGKVAEFRLKRTVLVVDLVLAAWGRPVGCIPDGSI